jgi:hypothetical protein
MPRQSRGPLLVAKGAAQPRQGHCQGNVDHCRRPRAYRHGIRTKIARAKAVPALLFHTLRSTARQGNMGGPGAAFNPDYGYGILDPVAAYQTLALLP